MATDEFQGEYLDVRNLLQLVSAKLTVYKYVFFAALRALKLYPCHSSEGSRQVEIYPSGQDSTGQLAEANAALGYVVYLLEERDRADLQLTAKNVFISQLLGRMEAIQQRQADYDVRELHFGRVSEHYLEQSEGLLRYQLDVLYKTFDGCCDAERRSSVVHSRDSGDFSAGEEEDTAALKEQIAELREYLAEAQIFRQKWLLSERKVLALQSETADRQALAQKYESARSYCMQLENICALQQKHMGALQGSLNEVHAEVAKLTAQVARLHEYHEVCQQYCYTLENALAEEQKRHATAVELLKSRAESSMKESRSGHDAQQRKSMLSSLSLANARLFAAYHALHDIYALQRQIAGLCATSSVSGICYDTLTYGCSADDAAALIMYSYRECLARLERLPRNYGSFDVACQALTEEQPLRLYRQADHATEQQVERLLALLQHCSDIISATVQVRRTSDSRLFQMLSSAFYYLLELYSTSHGSLFAIYQCYATYFELLRLQHAVIQKTLQRFAFSATRLQKVDFKLYEKLPLADKLNYKAERLLEETIKLQAHEKSLISALSSAKSEQSQCYQRLDRTNSDLGCLLAEMERQSELFRGRLVDSELKRRHFESVASYYRQIVVLQEQQLQVLYQARGGGAGRKASENTAQALRETFERNSRTLEQSCAEMQASFSAASTLRDNEALRLENCTLRSAFARLSESIAAGACEESDA